MIVIVVTIILVIILLEYHSKQKIVGARIMAILKPVSIALVSLAIGIGASSAAFAKAHDAGVADGTIIDPSVLRNGGVAGLGVPGVGRDETGFLGVAADLELGVNYGRDIVQDQIANGVRRVTPVVNNRR